ncbi:MAG: prolyl-tRNA synthetase [Actinomycetota bacterium]|nr:prolyl-tRNA synthetase [Actinomycetota bacterium]
MVPRRPTTLPTMAKAPVLTPQSEDFPKWYQDVVAKAEMAENGPVRGTMVIRPYGYAIWERMQRELDDRIKEAGAKNAYFPLFIPESYLRKEAQHVEGFSPELAVVTIGGGKELEEPVVVRPTSETIINVFFAKWIQSYRDLPLLINQWANVVRWEMRTRMFLRTTEFLWQEGHTAHATEQEAVDETMQMLRVYAEFAEQWMAIPVIQGEKTEGERFPGAVKTYCIEAMMQDHKALQAGTSHFLGQNFAKASGIQFQDEKGGLSHAWTTSWGVSTRMVGAMIMTHADDDGMVMPPRLAPHQIVIIPVIQKPEVREQVLAWCTSLKQELEAQSFAGTPVRVHVDARDVQGSKKVWEWIKKGAPIRLEVGPKDIEKGSVFMGRRDKKPKDKQGVPRAEFVAGAAALLQEIQDALFNRALAFREAHTRAIDTKEEFYAWFAAPPTKNANDPTPIHGGFAMTHFNGDPKLEAQIKDDLGVTVRCVPLAPGEAGICPFTGQPSAKRVVWAKSY